MDDLISRQAAIRWVKTECNPYGKPTLDFESGKKVIKHLERMPSSQPEQRWIPVTERLPKNDTEVIVSCTDDSGDSEFSYTTIGWHFKGIWVVCNERSYFVRAWMPLPEAWKGEKNE